ncbi:SDR family oxidoreductase [Nonomuraea sp. SMC257]|uniref:SDR family oxidoreductase n=1 Tax=Nonomuraea montanisoli TaxID=2741721 RepID=A0A7Y6ICW5_9ACTN|nr:UDP-glucuronic acid decarboxylase family protein [Nonomuraea montanisoli]NUW34539.1 SDR family oxidoreductase [Nonomuraea montanisoli]
MSSTRGRVAVTGGAGFLGSHLCDLLIARDYEVVCVDDFSTGIAKNIQHLVDHPAFTLIEADVAVHFDIPGKLDFILHLACPASPVDYLRMPIKTLEAGSLGTRNALRLARRDEARFLLASTSEIYGDPQSHPQAESYWGNVNPVGPRSVYDEAKRFGEALTAAYRRHHHVDTCIVRIFNTFGPRMRIDDGRMIPTFINQALVGEPITVTGDGTQTRSLCYVDDTVEGIYRAMTATIPGPINIGGDEEMSVLTMASLVRDLVGGESPVTYVDGREDDPRSRRPDLSLAVLELDWRPRVPLEEGILRTVEWYSEALPALFPSRTVHHARSLPG